MLKTSVLTLSFRKGELLFKHRSQSKDYEIKINGTHFRHLKKSVYISVRMLALAANSLIYLKLILKLVQKLVQPGKNTDLNISKLDLKGSKD